MGNKKSTSIVVRPEGRSVEEVRQSMEINLGRKIPTLEAEQLMQIYGALTNAAYSRSIRAKEKNPSPERRLFSLDDAAADDGASKGFLRWLAWWKQKKDGRINASSGDHYNDWKELRIACQSKDVIIRGRAVGVRNGIRTDLKETV